MSYARAMKHHRAAQRQSEDMAAFGNGFFMTKKRRNEIIGVVVFLMFAAFIKGFILSRIFFNHISE